MRTHTFSGLGSTVLYSPKDDGGAGGGGGGGSSGKGSQSGEGADTLTKAEILELVNDTVTGAVQNHMKASEKRSTAALDARFKAFGDEFSKSLSTMLDERLPTGGNGGGGTDNAGKGGKSDQADLSKHPQFVGMQTELAEMRKREETANAKAADSRRVGREKDLRSHTLEQLTRAKITGLQAEHALGYLTRASGQVRYQDDDSDTIVFAPSSGGDPLDFKRGFEKWLQSDDAKLYLPPRGTAGSGGATGGGKSAGTGDGSNGGAVDLNGLGEGLRHLMLGTVSS